MKSKAEVLQAFKKFVKDFGAPEAIIRDMSGEKTSQYLKRFCQEIDTTV